jgi:hypothetical protein
VIDFFNRKIKKNSQKGACSMTIANQKKFKGEIERYLLKTSYHFNSKIKEVFEAVVSQNCIWCTSKGIGNGYPVSIVLINKPTTKQLELNPFHYSQSHQNDPLGASRLLGFDIIFRSRHFIDGSLSVSTARSHCLLFDSHLTCLTMPFPYRSLPELFTQAA